MAIFFRLLLGASARAARDVPAIPVVTAPKKVLREIMSGLRIKVQQRYRRFDFSTMVP
jgi:hypothetical protein